MVAPTLVDNNTSQLTGVCQNVSTQMTWCLTGSLIPEAVSQQAAGSVGGHNGIPTIRNESKFGAASMTRLAQDKLQQ